MVKKVVKKKTSKKKTVKKKTAKTPVIRKPKIPKDDARLGKILIENFVGLQKVMVNLSVKFDDLSNKISKLLDLFEISAKALAEKDLTLEKTARDDNRIVKEIGNLSEQNKVIARGLTLMNDRLSGEPERPMERPPQMSFPRSQRNPPRQQQIKNLNIEQERKVIPPTSSMEGYQKSVVSEPTFKKLPT